MFTVHDHHDASVPALFSLLGGGIYIVPAQQIEYLPMVVQKVKAYATVPTRVPASGKRCYGG